MDVAELGLAASAIVDALKNPADFDTRADKPAPLRALLNLDAVSHRHLAFEARGRAVIGLSIAVDRRRLLRSADSETGVLAELARPP
ncbi:MAG: hypothetical protein WA633_04590 [Stellaceae bacterium]